VLVESNDDRPGWQVSARLAQGSNWVHAGLYVGNGQVIDATTQRGGVAVRSLEEFARTHNLAAVRPRYASEADRKAALARAEAALGTPYDYEWRLDNGRFYCGELVAECLAAGPNPIVIPTVPTVTGAQVSAKTLVESPQVQPLWSTGSDVGASM